jgi:hypothetical protein
MRAPRNSRRRSPVNNSHHRCRSRPLSITDPLTRDYGPAGHAGSSDPCRQAHRPAIVRTAISPGRPIRCSRASVHRRLGDRVNHHLDARGRSRSPPRARRKDYLVSSVPAGSTFRGEGSQYGRRTGRQGSSQGARCTPVDDLPQRGGAREARGHRSLAPGAWSRHVPPGGRGSLPLRLRDVRDDVRGPGRAVSKPVKERQSPVRIRDQSPSLCRIRAVPGLPMNSPARGSHSCRPRTGWSSGSNDVCRWMSEGDESRGIPLIQCPHRQRVGCQRPATWT